MHPPRIHWVDHSGARDESSGRFGDSSHGIWEPGASSPKFAEGHRDGRKSRRFRAPAHTMWYRVHGLLGTTANDSGHDLTRGWLELGLSVPDARPDVHWTPVEASSVIARHEEAAAFDAAKSQLKSSRTSTLLTTTTARKSKFTLWRSKPFMSSSRDRSAKVQRAKKAG